MTPEEWERRKEEMATRMETKRLNNKVIHYFFNDVQLFRGNLFEYERFVGAECEILAPSVEAHISCGPSEKVKDLYNKGIEAIVNYQYTRHEAGTSRSCRILYGLPVRRKKV